jgi:hypothetical protein
VDTGFIQHTAFKNRSPASRKSDLADDDDGNVRCAELQGLAANFFPACAKRNGGSNDRRDDDNAFQTLHVFSPLVKQPTSRFM